MTLMHFRLDHVKMRRGPLAPETCIRQTTGMYALGMKGRTALGTKGRTVHEHVDRRAVMPGTWPSVDFRLTVRAKQCVRCCGSLVGPFSHEYGIISKGPPRHPKLNPLRTATKNKHPKLTTNLTYACAALAVEARQPCSILKSERSEQHYIETEKMHHFSMLHRNMTRRYFCSTADCAEQ